MTIDEFSKHLIEKALIQLDEKGKCNGSGAGKSCPLHGDADCNSSKQNRAEAWEGSKEDKDEDKKLAKKNKMSLKTWEKSDADKKHDMKKEEAEKAEKEKDEGGKHKEYKHAKGKEEKGEKKTEKEMKEELKGGQKEIDKNHNGKIDGQDFAILRGKKAKKSVKEMWEKAAEVQEGWNKKKAVDEGKKVQIEIMPDVDTPNDPEPPTGKKPPTDKKSKLNKEEVEDIAEVKMDGKDDNGFKSCWKGYKKQGTKEKGGKEVNNCVKAGYEMEDGEELQEKRLSAKEKAKKEKFVKGMKKKFSSMKSKYGSKAQNVMFGAATNMAKKAA